MSPQRKFDDRFQHCLGTYALAAGAAGVGLLVSAPPAEGRIVYHPTHRVLTNGTLPLPVAGTSAFSLSDKFYIVTGSFSTQFLDVTASAGAGVVGAKSASALPFGKLIGPKAQFQTGKKQMAAAFCETQVSASTVLGPFANTRHKFLGLKFTLQGKVHYGWARFSSVTAAACNGGPAISATLTGYAYETIAGKPIVAGKTSGSDASVDPLPTLGRLARGASR